MLPIRWDPIRDLNTLQRELDALMRRTFAVPDEEGGRKLFTATPAMNTFVKDGVFHLQAELPGVNAEKLDLSIDGNLLVVRGERSDSHKAEDVDYLIQETRFSTFERRLSLPEGVDPDQAHAHYEDGLLEVTMPIIKKETGGRKIPIEGLGTGKKSKEMH